MHNPLYRRFPRNLVPCPRICGYSLCQLMYCTSPPGSSWWPVSLRLSSSILQRGVLIQRAQNQHYYNKLLMVPVYPQSLSVLPSRAPQSPSTERRYSEPHHFQPVELLRTFRMSTEIENTRPSSTGCPEISENYAHMSLMIDLSCLYEKNVGCGYKFVTGHVRFCRI